MAQQRLPLTNASTTTGERISIRNHIAVPRSHSSLAQHSHRRPPLIKAQIHTLPTLPPLTITPLRRLALGLGVRARRMSISTIPSTPTHISLSITSDTICPFCYIGYNRLTRALSLTQQSIPSLTYTIRFSPFELDPTLPRYPTPSKDKKAHYHAKFGEASFTGMEKAMKERGKAEGISFSYGGKVGNTIDSHRIIEKAWVVGGEEAQRKVVERLFRWYFEEEGDIANWEGLSRVVGELGVCGDEGEVMKFLKGGELEGSVREGLRKARERRITGVPFTVINDKFAVSGAQEVETFVEAFKKIANEEM